MFTPTVTPSNIDATTNMLMGLFQKGQLQQYVQQHADDPNIVALGLQVSKIGNAVKGEQARQQVQQQQPTIAEQAIASMGAQPMPENVGIGQLPAQNIQRMADGGIAGYAEGGPNPASGPAGQLAYNNEPVLRMADGGIVALADGDLVKDNQIQSLLKDRARYVAAGADTSGIDQAIATLRGNMGRGSVNPAFVMPTEDLGPVPGAGEGSVLGGNFSLGKQPSSQDLGPVPGSESSDIFGGAKATPVVRPESEAPAVGKPAQVKRPSTPGAGAATPGAPAKDVFGLASLREAQREAMGDSDYEVGAMRNQLAGMRADLEKRAEDRLAGRKQEIEQEGDVFKERTGRLAEREKELEKSKEITTGLAFLQAAGAMLQPGTHWTTAIGKGISTGAAAYGEGLEKLRAAQDKLNDAKDRNEELRLNRSDMNKREIRQLERERDADVAKGQELMFGFAKDVYGMNRQDARELMKQYTEGQFRKEEMKSRERMSANEIAARERVANLPGAQERIALLLGGGDLAKGLERVTSIQAGKFNPMTAYTEYLSKRKEGDTTLSPAEFVNQIRSVSALMSGAPTPTGEPTGKVRE